MKNIISLFFLLFFGLLAKPVQAQTKKVESFTLPDAVSGKQIALKDFQNQKAIVVLFTSNTCPYSKLYEERFASLVKEFKGRDVAFIIINPNDPRESQEDSMEAMKTKADSWSLDIPYLADRDQTASRMFGASKNPEVFVLSQKPSPFTIVYSGALDDNPQVAEDVSQNYVKQALEAVLKGKKLNSSHKRPVGCMIKMRN